MNATDKFLHLPQQSEELERAVLGAMITSSSSLRDALTLLRGGAEVFYHTPHKHIFKAIHALNSQGKGVEYVTLMQQLTTDGKLATAGGSAYVKELIYQTIYGPSVKDYCEFMIALWSKRRVADTMRVLLQGANDPRSNIHELLAEAYTHIHQVQQGLQVKGPVVLTDVIDPVADAIEQAAATPGGMTGVTSGLKSIDDMTGGWQPSDLIIIAARPGVGKTSFALANAVPAALAGQPGAIFNLEMNNLQMGRKMVATELGEYSTSQLQKGYFPSGGLAEAKTIRERAARLRNAEIYLDETPGLEISEFRGKAARLKADHGICWIIVDYLQLMTANGKGNREQEIAAISRGLKLTAKELNVPVLALSQLSRTVESRGGEKKPILSDLRESGAIEQDADVVVFLYRPEYHGIKQDEMGGSVENTTDVIFAKHRNGPLGEVTLGSTMKNGRYFDLDIEPSTLATPEPAPVPEQFGPRILGLRTAGASEFSDPGEPLE
ncbi:replicative DNA helicase [Hymenobacter sp. GOD-10R]|uniref:replicative DNA helicase n=1 Tax=Hymenobacter sp. GOD-10R TaxID=3093922 RepID=UPI002D7669BA|nr:replicative DNA helicase [Hymenobacter sp. GOD-10R]WRQ27078.1 replicative DNA helicase [Hymenobacter sp. GOD-10R]